MARRGKKPRPRVLSEAEIDGLLVKLHEPGSELDASERGKLAGLVESFAHVIELVASGRSSELPRLLGISRGRGSEVEAHKNDEPAGPESESARSSDSGADAAHASDEQPREPPAKNRDEHGRRGASAFGKLAHAHHAHQSLHAGDACPECERGRVYKYEPDQFTTVSGQSPLVATRHTLEKLRCNLCKAVFKAPLPEILLDDGIEERRLYSYSAVAMVVFYRFFAGLPMHRQDRLQRALGVPIPDASIWDMCERFADLAGPIVGVLHSLAADAALFYGDDTGAKILDTRSKVRPNRKTGENERRTGCHTTCIIALTAEDKAITLFATGIHHTGEVMDLVVGEREAALAPPIFMGDCIASNTVTAAVVLYAGCNAHAVRRFKALAERYPEPAGFVLDRYQKIYEHEAHCREHGLGGEARRDYHEEHSRPLLREICEHGQDLVEQRKMEPNSDLAAAFSYVIENERRLSAFTRHPHAPLDNNRCERELKLSIQLRDSARFFRNTIGAGVADTVLTLGATALAAEVNLPDYFVAIQRHANDARQHPEPWLPWSYKDRLNSLERARTHGPEPPRAPPA